MATSLVSKIVGGTTKKRDTSSTFSKFFREASSRERKRVFLKVAKQASKEQRDVIESVQIVK